MTASQVIDALKQMPPDAEVAYLWDGRARSNVEHVWLSRGGYVVTADYGMVCYDGNDRPLTAPTTKEDEYWQTPDDPNDTDQT